MAKTTRGFRLGRKLVRVFRWCLQRRHMRRQLAGPISKIRKWVHSLTRGAGITHSGYTRIGKLETVNVQRLKLPKGHLVVYVGGGEEDACPVAVPVVYFNHPLFGELLREAERVYGFDHPGGIQIPCPKSELESVRMRIAAASGGGTRRRRRR